MKLKPLHVLAAWALLTPAGILKAGTYNHNYDTFTAGPQIGQAIPNGTTNLQDGSFVGSNNGPASVQSGKLRLTQDGTGSTQALYRLPDLDPGSELAGFDIQFDLSFQAAGTPADGMSLSFGALPLTDTVGPGEEGYQLPGGMVISFDTYINNPPETTRTLDVRIDGNQLVTFPESAFGNYNMTGVARRVTVHWDANGLDVTYGTFTVCNNLAIPGLVPNPGDRFALSARTGGAFETVLIDNMAVSTAPQSPITRPSLAISEVVVDNTEYEDEHCQSPGWVEIYNGTAAPVSLNGWSLTDDALNPGKWPFPAAQSVPAYGYLVVFLGHGTPVPTAPNTRLHTSFTLPAAGGFLGLYQGATAVDSLNFGQQFENVSYGYLGHAWTVGFLEEPTPGLRNRGVQEAGGPLQEEVTWPRDGGLITGPISIALAAPQTPGAEIRYTLDNTVPTPASTLYTAPINVTTSTNIRARISRPGFLPGPVSGKSFLKLHSTVTNYRGTGQAFSSNLPVVVIDSFGRNLDSENSTVPGARPFRPTYNVVLAPDPANGNRTVLRETKHDNLSDGGAGNTRSPVDFQGRSGMHVRGESSAGMPQRQYAWETRNSEDEDKDVSILGMPQESDWILYAPSTDKTLMRNFIAYSSMFDTNGEGSAMRTRFVEVFFNQPGTADGNSEITWQDYRGVYVLVEKIKRGNDRVDVANLDPCDVTEPDISGGYIFKKDKASVDPDFTTNGGQVLQVVEPAVAIGDAQYTWLRNYVNSFEAALNGANYADPVLGYRAYIEEQTFMDNQWWVEVFKQIDGYRLSTYFSKDRGGKIKSAPLWDYNLSGGNSYYLEGYKYAGWYSSLVGGGDYQFYGRLRQDAGYTFRHWDRYWKLRNSTFKTTAIMARLDDAVNQVTDGQPLLNITNGTGAWPNSIPSAEVPAARHHARWQRLGIYDWPNAPGFANRSRYTATTDATDYVTYTATPYAVPASSTDATIGGQGTAVAPMSEVVHFKSHLTNRLNWIDDQNTSGTTILRPPVLSHSGGLVTAPFQLTISPYSGTPPAGFTYAAGTIFYTLDGTDPMGGGQASVVRNWVTESSSCHAAVVASASFNADSTGKDWRDPDFNPLSPPVGVTWYAGTQGVGYDDSLTPVNMNTEVNVRWSSPLNPLPAMPQMRSIANDSYVVLPFTLTAADIQGINKLRLYAKYDDGFVAWVNGVQIASRAAPATPVWNSLATLNRDDLLAVAWEDVTTVNNAAALAALRAGTNVLAIQGMQFGGANNADFLLRFRLDGEISNQSAYSGPITLNAPATVKARLFDTATGAWTPMTEATFTFNTVPASAANIVVSEIMYNPSEPTPAEVAAGFNNDNMFEYLEFQNISSDSVDMAGVSFPNGFTFEWPTANVNLRILAPGERAVIVGHLAGFNFRYAPGPGVKIAGVFDGNLGNGGEHLVMSGPGGVIRDFSYEDDPPWPAEADGDGYSLVLNNPAANPDHNLAVNWRASYGINGTPGTAAGPAGPTAATALLDDDGDGMTNLMEHATGSSGSDPSSQSWPVTGSAPLLIPPAVLPENYLTFTYTRGRAADGFSLEPLVSTALNTWQPLSTLFTLHSQTNNPDGSASLVWRSTEPASSLPPRIFLQVRATLNP
jgi:hypothetical protein